MFGGSELTYYRQPALEEVSTAFRTATSTSSLPIALCRHVLRLDRVTLHRVFAAGVYLILSAGVMHGVQSATADLTGAPHCRMCLAYACLRGSPLFENRTSQML